MAFKSAMDHCIKIVKIYTWILKGLVQEFTEEIRTFDIALLYILTSIWVLHTPITL